MSRARKLSNTLVNGSSIATPTLTDRPADYSAGRSCDVKLVTVIVSPHCLEDLAEALDGAGGVSGMTITDAAGFGRQRGHSSTYRGAEYVVDFAPKARVEILLAGVDVRRVVEAVSAALHTGEIGDGKVWVTPVEGLVRIRTGERGRDAL